MGCWSERGDGRRGDERGRERRGGENAVERKPSWDF